MVRSTLAAIVLLVGGSPCQAEIIALCGASEGHGYYPWKPPLAEDQAGWAEDTISSGNFQLIRSGPDFDVIFTDSTGDTLSSRAAGADIVGFITDDGDVVLTITYQKVIETYVFWLSLAQPVVTFSQAKFGALIPKHGLMRADCQVVTRPALPK